MTLREAYARLGFEHPVNYAQRGTVNGFRGIGSSYAMMVELYLDLPERGKSNSVFLVVCSSFSMGRILQQYLMEIHRRLDRCVDPHQVEFFVVPTSSPSSRYRGGSVPTWGVFCDHDVKEQEQGKRLRPPYSLVRRVVEQKSGLWEALDRDDQLVCCLSTQAVHALMDLAVCPIRYEQASARPGASARLPAPITFPAWDGPSLASNLRYEARNA